MKINIKEKIKKGKAFTLIELAVVIAIIAILMAFVLPAIGNAVERAKKGSAENAMKQFAKAYLLYRQDKGDFPADATTANLEAFATLLAREEYLNDPNFYILSVDSIPKPIRKTILDGQALVDKTATTSEAFPAPKKFSIEVIVGLSESCPENTTPIAYTRGLEGSFWNGDAVFGAKGGYIAFLDGQVKWFADISGKLMKADMTAVASNIMDAIPSGARILKSDNTVTNKP
ncbi:MAG: type II secretion system GspH family protein [Puniceicoccales bacterium]|jgi:prepilin-type N-terminal cleavage/methylation domain-containing protein|nr:type II secretion system GspH family protein [Puniceicoccales bacterium]